MAQQRPAGVARLQPFDRKSEALNAVVEAVRGSRNKFKFDPASGLFVHDNSLQAGSVYPFDFGFIPSTKGEDGDPIDVLILMDEPAFVGAVVPSRLVGAICAEQEEKDGEVVRNDRLIAAACKSNLFRDVKTLSDLPSSLVEEVERFFVDMNAAKGRSFRPVGRIGPEAAERLVRPKRTHKRR